MEEKYNVRPVKVEDYVDLIEWWKFYDHVEVPSSDILPNSGLGGLVVEKEGRMIAAAYIYLTNSAIGYVDFLVSDPSYKGRDRFEMITLLIDACSEVAVNQGCRIVWAMTTYDGVVRRCEKLGHEVLEDKYSVIYTHQKTAERIIKKQENG